MIRWHNLSLAAGAAALTLAGCAGRPAAPECTFPDVPASPAPAWVCDAPVEGVAVSAVGAHEPSAAGAVFAKDQAAAVARVRLAQQMRVHVSNMVKQYAETTGAGSGETVDRVNTSVSKLITAETLAGSKVFRSATSPKGTVYVLVGLDPKLAEMQAQGALRSSMNSDRAAWQQMRAGKSQDELAAEITRLGAPK